MMERWMCPNCLEPIERGKVHHCQRKAPPVASLDIQPTAPQGLRYDNGKVRISLLPGLAIEEVMKVGEFGSKKYGDHNYRKGMPVSKYINAAYRHIFVEWLFKGIDKDPESNLSHLAHGAWNILAALEQMLLKPDLDDRYGKGEGK